MHERNCPSISGNPCAKIAGGSSVLISQITAPAWVTMWIQRSIESPSIGPANFSESSPRYNDTLQRTNPKAGYSPT